MKFNPNILKQRLKEYEFKLKEAFETLNDNERQNTNKKEIQLKK